MTSVFTPGGELPKMLHRVGIDRIFHGAARVSPLLGSKKLNKKKTTGGDVKVNLSTSANNTVGVYDDGGAITHGGPAKKQVTADPVIWFAGLQIGRMAVLQSRNKSELASHLKDELDDMYNNLGSKVDKACLDKAVATCHTAVTAGAITSITIKEIYQLEVGDVISVLDVSNSNAQILPEVEITGFTWNADPAGPHTVTFASATLSANIAAGDLVVTKGLDRTTAGRTFYSIGDAADPAVDVHGESATSAYNFKGVQQDFAGAMTTAKLYKLNALRQKKSKTPLDYVVSDSFMVAEYQKIAKNQLQYAPGGPADANPWSAAKYEGKDWILDENSRQNVLRMVGKGCLELCEQLSMRIDGFEGKEAPKSLAAYRADDSLNYEFDLIGAYMIRHMNPKGVAEAIGVDLT